jgi:ABC-type lipoprotein export system ATPase subunit
MSELLRFTDVSKRYRRGSRELHVLREVSFTLNAGEVLGVVGDRAGGKTTLIEIAAGLESADVGTVWFQGRELSALSGGERSRLLGGQIGLAGNSGPMMDLRLLDYVAMALMVGADSGSAETRAWSALERVGVEGCADQAWEDICDWERARVEVAQAIARDPALLLVDDLTDTLGIRETEELAALLRSLSQESQMAVLMAVSDADAALYSDRIVRLSGGTLTGLPHAGGNVFRLPDRAVEPRHVEGGSIS